MEKFHHFLCGTHFILETDQKPLEVILSKSLNQATPWLQRILIQTFPYHFTVCHILGPMNQLVDCLSRLGNQNDNIKLPKLHIYQITSKLKAKSDTLNQLHIATQEDDKLIFWNTQLQMDGLTPLKRYHPRYKLTGPSMKNSQLKMDCYWKVPELSFQRVRASKY